MLTIKNLRKRYGNFQALDGLNLEVADGELFGFVGPNGAGKTTTLKILAGLLVPDEGEVEIGGLDVYSDGKELRRRIGYVPDFFGVYDNLKVSEYMEFFASCYGITGLQARTRCHTLLEQVRLEDKEDFFVDGLSRGMKQSLCLARALIHDPDLLILMNRLPGWIRAPGGVYGDSERTARSGKNAARQLPYFIGIVRALYLDRHH